MLECNLLKDEGRLVVKENGEDVFASKVVINSNVALLDEIMFSNKKKEEISSGNALEASVGFLRDVEDSFRSAADNMGLNIDFVTFGNFAVVKRLDEMANTFDLNNSRQVGMR